MTRTLYLHVGLPKTASTALQETLFPQLSGLTVRSLPRGALFDGPADRRGEHRLLANACRRDPSVWDAMGPAIWDALAVPDDGHSLLLSDEGIGRAGSRPDQMAAHVAGLRRVAEGHGFGRLAVIAFIRRQADWLASHYAQTSDRTRGAGQAGFERMAARTLDPARALHGFGTLLRYDLLHEALSGVTDDLLLAPMEAMREDRDVFIRRLTTFLGAAPVEAKGSGRRNVRAAPEGWRLRPPTIGLPGGGRAAVPLTRPGTIRLTPAIEEGVARAYGAANARLAARAALPLEEHGYALR